MPIIRIIGTIDKEYKSNFTISTTFTKCGISAVVFFENTLLFLLFSCMIPLSKSAVKKILFNVELKISNANKFFGFEKKKRIINKSK